MNYDSLTELIKEFPQLVHASNIVSKLKKSNLSNKQTQALKEIEPKYLKYINSQLDLKGYSKKIIDERVDLLNNYYQFLDDNYLNIFTSQGKFRPTILEEFIYILFKDLVSDLRTKLEVDDKDLLLGSVKAYTNLYFKSDDLSSFIKEIHTGINVKDQDFAIYREMLLSINNESHKKIKLPIIATECKTYLDKTMLEGAIATAEKIKSGNPYSKFFVVAETYEVDHHVDPAYSRIDQIFVLRKNSRKQVLDIQKDVVYLFFNEVYRYLHCNWGNIEHKLQTKGIII